MPTIILKFKCPQDGEEIEYNYYMLEKYTTVKNLDQQEFALVS
jgi:hypothetical protein